MSRVWLCLFTILKENHNLYFEEENVHLNSIQKSLNCKNKDFSITFIFKMNMVKFNAIILGRFKIIGLNPCK